MGQSPGLAESGELHDSVARLSRESFSSTSSFTALRHPPLSGRWGDIDCPAIPEDVPGGDPWFSEFQTFMH